MSNSQAVPVDVRRFPGAFAVVTNYSQIQPPPPDPIPVHETVQDFIASLDPWERIILENVQFLVPQNEAFDALSTHPFTICSDGSQVQHRASFAWVLADHTGRRLARCSGPSHGGNPNSYRAEGYGLLSVHRFLYHLVTQFQVNVRPSSVRCDNKALVNRVNNSPSRLQDAHPNSTLDAEWDTLMQIWETLQNFEAHNRPATSHIKGHQDKDKPYAELSLPAQLNVDADALANQFIQENLDLDYGIAPMIPTAQVQLHMTQGTITHKMKRFLRLGRTAPALEHHLKKKYDWSDETFQDIDWETHRRALRKLQKHKVTLIKHVNNYSPVGALISRYDPKYTAECPTCETVVETRQHLYQCHAQRRLEWREQFYRDLQSQAEKSNTSEDLRELLISGIMHVVDPTIPIDIPETATDIATAQEAIGWSELLKGRLSKKWAAAQQRHLGAFNPKENGQKWAADMATVILQGWLNLWASRNEDKHGRDRETRARTRREQAHRELELLYELQGSILAEDNWILSTPLETRKNLSTNTIRKWIAIYGPILEESHHQEQLQTG